MPSCAASGCSARRSGPSWDDAGVGRSRATDAPVVRRPRGPHRPRDAPVRADARGEPERSSRSDRGGHASVARPLRPGAARRAVPHRASVRRRGPPGQAGRGRGLSRRAGRPVARRPRPNAGRRARRHGSGGPRLGEDRHQGPARSRGVQQRSAESSGAKDEQDALVYGSPPFDEPVLAWQRCIYTKGAFNLLADGPYDEDVEAISRELDADKRAKMTQALAQLPRSAD
jgi:hypothetical protein